MGRLLFTVLSAASALCLGSAAHPAASGKEGKGEDEMDTFYCVQRR